MWDWMKWRVRTRRDDWMKRVGSAPPQPVDSAAEATTRPRAVAAGKYLSLYTYLENRYAGYVVLTFAQIEDLLGFKLPELARLQQEWWTNVDPKAGPEYSHAWPLTHRIARPNLSAQTVAFERVP